MSKIWPYIAIFLLGFSAGMIVFYYIVRDRIMNKKVIVGRSKMKGGMGNTQDMDLEMNEAESARTGKELRQERRAERKLKKQITSK